jgi:hypothetical protein
MNKLRGEWGTWIENKDHHITTIVGWLPDDESEPTSHKMAMESHRDAHLLVDILKSLEAKPQ